LNEVENNAEALLWKLPYGTRVIPTLTAQPDWRIEFVGHLADRACIGHCFTYSNYEPASEQFRVRVKEGSPIARSSYSEADGMEGGSYVFRGDDLPLMQLYQCDPNDLRRLRLRELAVGDRARMFGPEAGGAAASDK
jgi:hypothetical protein